MKEINLLHWDITYREFIDWILENKVDVYAAATIGANDPLTRYFFEHDEDFTAFRLAFKKDT